MDAIVEAAHLVTALQTVVSRNKDPLESGVMTIGKIEGGYKLVAASVTLRRDPDLPCCVWLRAPVRIPAWQAVLPRLWQQMITYRKCCICSAGICQSALPALLP